MSTTPWREQLDAAVTSWLCDVAAYRMSYFTPLAQYAHILYIAVRSDAEHELDYYSGPRWTIEDCFAYLDYLWKERI